MALFNVYADYILPVPPSEDVNFKNVRTWALDAIEMAMDKVGVISDKPIVDIPDEIEMFASFDDVEAWDSKEADGRITEALRAAGARQINLTVEKSETRE